MSKLSDDEFRKLVDHEVSSASLWSESTIAEEQERNLRYYLGQPIGNEVDGRSQQVSWDVFEVVEAAMPTFLEAFFAGDDVGEFEPVGIEDEQYAKQATDYVNYIVKKRNPGFVIFNTWFKDALISKIGVARVWWDDRSNDKKQEYKGITDDQLVMLAQKGNVEFISHSAYPDPDQQPVPAAQAMMMAQQPAMLHDVEVKEIGKKRGVCIDNVPPEQFLIDRYAKRADQAACLGEMRRYTRSDLVAMGYPKSKVDAISDYTLRSNDIMFIRGDESMENARSSREGAMEEVSLFYGFVKVDYDGDGIAEWRRVFMGGNDILENEEVDDHEYCIITPIPLPHRVIGMSYADCVAPIQELNTALTRQYVDSLFLANNPRSFAVDNQVNMNDLLNNRIGGIVRMSAPGMAGPLQTNVVAAEAMQGVEWGSSLREARIGVTRYNQGLDADSLNKTATGISKIFTAADKRQQMTLRIMAETGVKDLFRKVLRLVREYQDKADTIRLRGDWVEFDPSRWNAEMDVTISVGIGTGDKSETLQQLMVIGQWMERAAMAGLPIVQPENLYNLGKLMIKNAKIQGGEKLLLTEPGATQPKQPKTDPLVEAEQVKAQAAQQKQQAELSAEAQKFQAQAQLDEQSAQADRQQQLIIEKMKIESTERIKAAEIAAKKELELFKLQNGAMQHEMTLRHSAINQMNADQEYRGESND